MKRLLIVSIILAFMGMGANGFAQMGMGGGQGQGMMQNGAYKNMTWFTSLPKEKQSAVEKIIDNNGKEMTGLRLKMQEKKAKLDSMIFEDKTSQKDIDKVVSEINGIRGELYQKRVNMSIALKKAGVPYQYCIDMEAGRGKGGGMGMKQKMKDCPMKTQALPEK